MCFIIQLKKEQSKCLEPIFRNATDTLVFSFLQGYIGTGWADSENPSCGKIIVADFCYFGGDHTSPYAVEMIQDMPVSSIIAIPQNKHWGKMIEKNFGGKIVKFERYAARKDKNNFDRKKLEAFIKLPEEYTLVKIDAALYEKALKETHSSDFCSNFESVNDFLKCGIGFCILYNGEIVSGASSYTVYDGGIEIQIETKPEFMQKGLATVCGAKLILECLDNGLYPSWDAANMTSVRLAKKLGYIFDCAYTAYSLTKSG